jgi:hypothetical protein
MFDELNFRNQQGDGKIALAVAAIGVIATPLIAWGGWPVVFALAGGTAVLVARKIIKF